MLPLVFGLVAFVLAPYGAQGHSYHLGSCPVVEPLPGFTMNRMLGEWYVIQKTSTASSCLLYNFTRGEEPGEYTIEQISQHPILGLTPVEHQYHYVGSLSVPEPSTPARMSVRFPLSVAGSASYTVFSTDYENYAGIFTCQKIAFSNRQSVSILSREKTLDKMYLDKVRARLQTFNINPYDLSIISQSNCPSNGSGYNINIDSDTFSAASAAGVIRKAGEKIGDGVEYVAEGAKKVYNKFSDGPEKRSGKVMNPDSEWLP